MAAFKQNTVDDVLHANLAEILVVIIVHHFCGKRFV